MKTIKFENVYLNYTGKNIIEKLNLKIPCQEIIVIIGPNGCGKSTLLKSIGKLLSPSVGNIYFDETNIKQIPMKKFAQRVGFLHQMNTTSGDFVVEDIIMFGRFPHQSKFSKISDEDKLIVENILNTMKISHLRCYKLNELSGGMQQRIWLSMLLAQDVDLLLLDEPTTYLDLSFQMDILNTLKNLNRIDKKTIIMVLHDINFAVRYADRIIVLNQGNVHAYGTPTDIINKELIRDVFGIESEIAYNSKYGYLNFNPIDCNVI